MNTHDETASAEWKKHWPLVLATASGMALAGMLSAIFGVMLEPMQQELGWSRAELSTGPFVVSAMGLFLAAPAGYLIDRWGSRATGLIVVASTFIAIMAMSQVGEHLWQWWAAWSVFGVAGAFTSTVWMAPVTTIFHKGRGMAIAMTIAGASISAAISPSIAEYFIQHYNWRMAYVALGILWCGLLLPLVLICVPGKKALKAATKISGETTEHTHSPALLVPAILPGYTPAEGFKSRNFWLLFTAALVGGLTGLALLLNLVPVLTFTGISRADAVIMAGSVGVAGLIGRLIGGWLMDNFDVRHLATLAASTSMLFPIALVLAPGVLWIAMVALMLHGVLGGLKMSSIVYLTSTHMGPRSFGLFYGTVSTTTTVAMGLGPLIANHIYDMTNSYTPTIWAAIPGFMISAVCFALLGPAPDFKAMLKDQSAHH